MSVTSNELNAFQGWECYPSNLSTSSSTPDELALYRKRLQADSTRLFSRSTTNICLSTRICKDDCEPHAQANGLTHLDDTITTEMELESILMKHLKTTGDHFIFLHQSNTWSPLSNSETALRKLFTAFKISPTFLDFVHTFGPPSGDYDADSPDCFNSNFPSDASGNNPYEFMYNVKYMVKTGREDWPWSERKMGVYYRKTGKTGSVWIIIRPTTTVLSQVHARAATKSPCFTDLHLSIFHSALFPWKFYLRYLDSRVRKDSSRARLDNTLTCQGQQSQPSLVFSHMQDTYYQTERIHDAVMSLRSNREVINGMKSFQKLYGLQFTKSTDKNIHGNHYEHREGRLLAHTSLCRLNLEWAKDMLDRSKEVSNLTITSPNYVHSQAISKNTTSLDQIAQQSKKDEQVIFEITRATKKDSAAMKLITVVTMIYLPGTLVASIFSTGFVNVFLADPSPQIMHQSLIQGFSYTGVTAGLTIATLVVALYRIRRMEGVVDKQTLRASAP